MSTFLRQSDSFRKICQYLVTFFVLMPFGTLQAGEAAVDLLEALEEREDTRTNPREAN